MKAQIRAGSSFSGYERDKLWLRSPEGDFVDVSGLSGLDSVSDGRAFGWTDLDHDGDLDVVLVSSNSPQLQVFENLFPPRDSVAVQAPPGSRVHLRSEHLELHQEVRLGEGFAAQNSATLVLATGGGPATVEVVLPGGGQQASEVAPGELVVFGDAEPRRQPYQAAQAPAGSSPAGGSR